MAKPHSDTDKTLALAGIFQAVYLVQQVARQGLADALMVEDTLQTLFVTDPQDVPAVFGGVAKLRRGLGVLVDQLGADSERRDIELTRYLIALLHLERKLTGKPAMLDTIANGLERSRRQLQHYPIVHGNVLAGLADIYVNTISTLTPRIIVAGEQGFLAQEENAARVRALLLAAIRAAVLWDQCCGSRMQLLFRRRRFLASAQGLLREAERG